MRGGQTSMSEIRSVFEDPVWAEVYAACCVDTGEVLGLEQARSFNDSVKAQNPGIVPASGAAAQPPESLTLRCLRIGVAAVSCLASQLRDRPYFRVDLGENQLGDHAMLSVRNLVRALPQLRWLGLAGNFIGPEGARELAEELRGSRSLECLVLGESGDRGRRIRPHDVGTEGLKSLLEGLRRNPQRMISSLSICHAALGSEAGRHLASFLEGDRMLQHLDVSGNPLSSEGVCALLPKCARLRSLSIADTGCRGELIHPPLCALLRLSRDLAHLSLAHNTLETKPLRRIARAIASCESLVSLDLEQTGIDTEGVTALADALLAAPVQSLTELDLSENNLGQVEASTALAHALTRSVIQVLRLNRNALGDAGVRELAEALDPSISAGAGRGGTAPLQHLELECCRIGTAGAGHLFSCVAGNENLNVLKMGDNFLDRSLDVGLLDRLAHVFELRLDGNRLSHITLRRAAQACARNRQRQRDEVPFALRADMHTLLFEETKLEEARHELLKDELEFQAREAGTEEAMRELWQLRKEQAETRRSISRVVGEEERCLEAAQKLFSDTEHELNDSGRHFGAQHEKLQERLRGREDKLVDLQAEKSQLDDRFARRREERPQQAAALRQRIDQAVAERQRFDELERATRHKLNALKKERVAELKPA